MTQVPAGWRSAALGDLLTEPLVNGRSVPTRPGGFPVLRLTALKGGHVDLGERKEGAWSAAEASPYLVREGDFLVARGNGSLSLVGRGGLVGPVNAPVAFPDTLIRVRPEPGQVDRRFLALLWSSEIVRRQIESQARTTAGIYKVNQQHLRQIQLPIPPVDEQRRVVDILEDHLSRLDAAAAYVDSGLASLDLLEQVVLAGSYRAAAELVPLGSVAAIQGGIQKQPKRAPRDNAYSFLRVANVTSRGLDLREVHRIELFGAEIDRYRLQRGDLLVVEGNGSASQIGRAALWDGSIEVCVHQNHLIRVRADAALLPEFLECLWNSPDNRRRLSSLASSTSGLHTLSVSKLKGLPVPLPDLTTQARAVATVGILRAKQERLAEELDRTQVRGGLLRRALFEAAFSGRLTGRSSDLDLVKELLGG